jgi:hypothetical protein
MAYAHSYRTSGPRGYSVLETFQPTRPRRERSLGRLGNHEAAAAGSASRGEMVGG